MPNIGFADAIEGLAKIESDQPLIVSVAGFSVNDYIEAIVKFQELDNVAAIELNFGCPNTQHGQIMSFMKADVGAIVSHVNSNGKPVWVKLSPYTNPVELKRMAETINWYPHLVRAVVTCNTFPNTYAGMGKIDPNQGRAGMSGPVLKPIALGQVHQFREWLNPSIDVIGVGGITSGNDIVDFLDAGASAVQMTSWPFWLGDPRRFMEELTDPTTSGRFLEYLNNAS